MYHLLWNHYSDWGVEVYLQAFYWNFLKLKDGKAPLLNLDCKFVLGHVLSLSHLPVLPFDSIVGGLGMLLCAVATELATLSFHCMLPTVIFTLTGSRLLLSALWNPEAVKQIEKWCVSTFRQCSNPKHFFPAWLIGFTPPAGWNIDQDNPTKVEHTLFRISRGLGLKHLIVFLSLSWRHAPKATVFLVLLAVFGIKTNQRVLPPHRHSICLASIYLGSFY